MASYSISVGVKLAATLVAILFMLTQPGPVSAGHVAYAVVLFAGYRITEPGLTRRSNGGRVAFVILVGAIVRGWVVGDAAAGVEVAVRGLLALGTPLLLSAHLPPADLARWLRSRGVSADLVGTMLLLVRYGDLLRQEAFSLERARRARCFSHAEESSWTAKSSLLGALFARAASRAERVYRAMLARGWQ